MVDGNPKQSQNRLLIGYLSMNEIEDLWCRLETWASQNAPAMLEDLNSGAGDEEIALLETALSVELPSSYKKSLAVHNGESDGWPCKIFADRGAYLSTQRVLEEWTERQKYADSEHLEGEEEELIADGIIQVSGPVQIKMFLPTWIPFLECNGDVFWAMDFSPAEGGTNGQIIEVDWEGCTWKVISDSFVELMERYVTGLEQGEYIIHDGQPTIANP